MQLPVRRRVIASQRDVILARLRACVLRLAMAHPHVTMTVPRLGTMLKGSLVARLRQRVPRVRQAYEVSFDEIVGTTAGLWRVHVDAAVGKADHDLGYLAVNGVPLGSKWSAVSALPVGRCDGLPWPWDGVSLRRWTAVVHDTLGRESARAWTVCLTLTRCKESPNVVAPPPPVRDWLSLLATLMRHDAWRRPGAAHKSSVGPLRTASQSPYFRRSAPYAPRPNLPRMLRVWDVQPRLRPTSLRHVHVLAQVEGQYVLCVCVDDTAQLTLLCLDQHAAHERVRLEVLVREYVEACRQRVGASVPLEAAVCVPLVLSDEAAVALRFWGWSLQARPDMSAELRAPATMWSIDAIPSVLRWQRRMSVAAMATACAQFYVAHEGPCTHDLDVPWLDVYRRMPPVLQDAVASHACHTALRMLPTLTQASSIR